MPSKKKTKGGGSGTGPAKKATIQSSRSSNTPPPRLPKTHLLIVQGGQHSAFVGDFLGLVEFFRKKISPTFAGDFWTVFPPEAYFKEKPHDTIKFEGRVMATIDSIYSDTNHYVYINENTICMEVFRWLSWKADETDKDGAKPGDSVILIFLAHGSWLPEKQATPLGMRLGKNDMLVPDFVDALRKFSKDIQVNVISTACYAAVFVEQIQADNQANRWIHVASKPLTRVFPTERPVSGRYQNSTFIAGFVKSLASLGIDNTATLETLQNDLKIATESHPVQAMRSTPTMYSDSDLATKVDSLILRRFADFPLTPENTAARRRHELNINILWRPVPDSSQLMEKASFAANFISMEHDSFGTQDTDMLEERFEEVTRYDSLRRRHAGDILRGMVIRGRHQAAVWNVFLQLCVQEACCLSSLELPVDWNNFPVPGTCFAFIVQMLCVFDCFCINWDSFQGNWGIADDVRWVGYKAPLIWLSTMIGRSFTSLNQVFNIVRATQQLGRIDIDALEKVKKSFDANPVQKAERCMNHAEKFYGSGTFGFWLPEDVSSEILRQDFNDSTSILSTRFFNSLEGTETAYRRFFDISKADFDQDVRDEYRDVRDWEG